MPRVLIIEDDKRIAQALDIRIKRAGYETQIAHDAVSGVTLAAQFQPDALLVDINLPLGDGFAVVEQIHTRSSAPVRTIYITASKKPGLMERAAATGAFGFIEKPYTPESLLLMLGQATEGATTTIAASPR
jgi:CheY-like chemotaxis protein